MALTTLQGNLMSSDARHLQADAHRRTPDYIIAAARAVLGKIDLDPASDVEAQKTVRALCWWDRSGLERDWSGFGGCPVTVWLNPPGGVLADRTSSAARWWAKLVFECTAGHVSEALFLGFTLEIMRTAQRFECRAPQSFPFCVPKARLKFPSSNGAGSGSPAAANAIFYLGPNVDRFRLVFSRIGACT